MEKKGENAPNEIQVVPSRDEYARDLVLNPLSQLLDKHGITLEEIIEYDACIIQKLLKASREKNLNSKTLTDIAKALNPYLERQFKLRNLMSLPIEQHLHLHEEKPMTEEERALVEKFSEEYEKLLKRQIENSPSPVVLVGQQVATKDGSGMGGDP